MVDKDEAADESVPAITGTDVTSFLKSKGVEKCNCPVCSQYAWGIMEDLENRGFPLRSQSATGARGQRTFPVLALVCTNCGYAWFMARRIIQEWMERADNGR